MSGLTLTIVAALGLVVGLVAPAFAETAKDPLSADEVDARIQKHRTSQVTLTVTDAAGKPLAGAPVQVKQVRHQFLSGCNIFLLKPGDTSAEQQAYQQRFEALLNYATLPFYWGQFERQQGQPDTARLRAMAEWCSSHGITPKGHTLVYHTVVPRWLAGKTPEEVAPLMLGRIRRDVADFAGLIDIWDVVNEAVNMPYYQVDRNPLAQTVRKMGRIGLIKESFAAARAAGPRATLVLNDYDTSYQYEGLVEECLEAGTPIDVIGIQSHMHGGYWGARKVWDACEKFARFGKPLHFTEVTIHSGEQRENMPTAGFPDWATTAEGEARQAAQVAEFYRTLFSHPSVRAVTWWDFSDKGAWPAAPAGLLRKDMSAKPAYDALLKLVKGEWRTGPLDLKTDAEGKVRFRGFLGTYAVEAAGMHATADVMQAGEAALMVKVGPAAARP